MPVGTVNADKVDKKKKDDKDLFKLTDLVIGAALLGRNKEANKKAVSQLDEKSQKTIEKIADKVDRDHPEGSRQEKEKATKELIQDLSGKSVRSTDDLTDGTAIRKALKSSTLATSKRQELMLKRETLLARSRRQSNSLRSIFSEKMGREAPKDVVDADKIVKERDEKRAIQAHRPGCRSALLGKNKEVKQEDCRETSERSHRRHSRRSLTA